MDGYRDELIVGMMRAYYDPDALAAHEREPVTLWHIKMNMQKLIFVVLLSFVMSATSGCVFRAGISQGNIIEQDDLDQLEVGMTRNQVRFLLGTPMVDDPFHADRWDYVYYLKVGRQDTLNKRWVSVLFDEGAVTEIRKEQELAPEL